MRLRLRGNRGGSKVAWSASDGSGRVSVCIGILFLPVLCLRVGACCVFWYNGFSVIGVSWGSHDCWCWQVEIALVFFDTNLDRRYACTDSDITTANGMHLHIWPDLVGKYQVRSGHLNLPRNCPFCDIL